jgi:hypothetical protein
MSGLSINDILIKIDQRLDDVRVIDGSAPPVSLDPLSEVGLYLTSDRLLADLYRQYLEAQRHYVLTIQKHGSDSPMSETAAYMADSAFCSMETRLIELRQEKELAAKVARVQEAQKMAYIKDMQARQAAYAQRGIKQPQKITRIPKQMTRQPLTGALNTAFWALFAMAFLQNEQNIAMKTRPVANDFSKAAA